MIVSLMLSIIAARFKQKMKIVKMQTMKRKNEGE